MRHVRSDVTCHVSRVRIALNIREKGRGDTQPGRLRAVQGIGWWLGERNIAQVPAAVMLRLVLCSAPSVPQSVVLGH